ncbi:hypothetical protein N9P38_01135 [Flavobacteriales bacterium]|nr:hypothetical protein [Flavobacteriales bacterium]
MNYKSLTLLLIGLFVSTLSLAQEPSYKWAEPNTNDYPARNINKLLSIGDDGFVLLRIDKTQIYRPVYFLERFNAELKKVDTRKVEFDGGVIKEAFFLDEIKVVNDKIYAMITKWSKSAQKRTQVIRQLSLDGTMDEGVELDFISAEKMRKSGSFKTVFSDDGSKLLVLSEFPFEKKAMDKIKLTCYTFPAMRPLWDAEKVLSFASKRSVTHDLAVDNSGNGYVFKRFYEKQKYTYTIYACNGKQGFAEPNTINMGGEVIEDYRMMFDTKNQFFMYSTYSNSMSKNVKKIKGTVFVKYSELRQTKFEKKLWDKALVAKVEGSRMAEKGEKAFLGYTHIKDILFRKDGKMLVLMEQLNHLTKTIAGTSPIQYSHEWHYKDFIVQCLDAESGELAWWQSFEKSQDFTTSKDVEHYGSYVYHLKNDRLFVLWNNQKLTGASIPAHNWTEPDGTKYVKHRAFNDKTVHGTFIRVIEPDGSEAFSNRKFGLPLFNMHKGAVFEMSLNTDFSFNIDGNLVIMATMHNGGKRFRFGFIGL